VSRTRLLLIVSFVFVFAAGLALGFLAERARHRPHRPSWLGERLDLTAEQREQMREIWSGVAGEMGGAHRDELRALREERDQAMQDLLTESQKAEHERLQQEYEDKVAELAAAREAAFEEAVRRTKEILTPEQRKQYEHMLEGMSGRGRPSGRPPGPPPEGARPGSPHREGPREGPQP